MWQVPPNIDLFAVDKNSMDWRRGALAMSLIGVEYLAPRHTDEN